MLVINLMYMQKKMVIMRRIIKQDLLEKTNYGNHHFLDRISLRSRLVKQPVNPEVSFLFIQQDLFYSPSLFFFILGKGSNYNPTAHIPDEYLPPNNILFLQNLPETITQQQLIDLFQRYPGFREVRMIPAKRSIAFVEYENEIQSAVARAELSGHPLGPEQYMKVTFARK